MRKPSSSLFHVVIKYPVQPWGSRGWLGNEVVTRLPSQESNGFSRVELSK
ncbi:hypothetical protein [Shimazuella soli]|nr:hypothetical protein [Shimazuella soli]